MGRCATAANAATGPSRDKPMGVVDSPSPQAGTPDALFAAMGADLAPEDPSPTGDTDPPRTGRTVEGWRLDDGHERSKDAYCYRCWRSSGSVSTWL